MRSEIAKTFRGRRAKEALGAAVRLDNLVPDAVAGTIARKGLYSA
jgi:hypothetical protein